MGYLFFSDLHIGSPDFNHNAFNNLIIQNINENLDIYMVGDIIDCRYIKKNNINTINCLSTIRYLIEIIRSRKITYIWGNHDSEVSDFKQFNGNYEKFKMNISFSKKCFLNLSDGRKVMVVHGDEVDSVIRKGVSKGQANRVTRLYYKAMIFDRILFKLTRLLFSNSKPLMPAIKNRIPAWQRYVERYENAISEIAKSEGANVVICGHIHVPKMKKINGLLYVNCGDWVENFTAVKIDNDNTISLIDHNGSTICRCNEIPKTK